MTYSVLKSGILTLSYTATNLTTGQSYKFYVQARNSLGFSPFSATATVLCAWVPFTPTTPTTTVVANQVIIAWNAPNQNGSPMLGYQILIRNRDNGYDEQLVNCNGKTDPGIISLANCTVPLVSLQVAPFNLAIGDVINAKVLAFNIYGNSQTSPIGGTGILVQIPDTPLSLKNNPNVTNVLVIGFSWTAGASNGGTPLLDYTIAYDQSIGVWSNLTVNYTQTSYVTTVGLQAGNTYNFRVYARNTVGFSIPAQISILCAQIANVPAAPITSVSGSNVVISWVAPYNGATPITSYTITIRQSDTLTYSTQLTNCNGADPAIVAATTCSIPITVLRSDPFNIEWGSSIHAKVLATNIVGSTSFSADGNGAIILTVPDAPVNLANVVTITSGSQIGLTWSPGIGQGGTPLLDYRITFDQGNGNFVQLVSGLTSTSYTVTGLTAGNTYQFKVQARNSFDYSDFSNVASILAAQ